MAYRAHKKELIASFFPITKTLIRHFVLIMNRIEIN